MGDVEFEHKQTISKTASEIIQESWEEPRLITDWVLVVAHVSDDMETVGYSTITDQSAPHVLEGLLRMGIRQVVEDDGEDIG